MVFVCREHYIQSTLRVKLNN